MIRWTYLAMLLGGLGCMVLMDRRWRLVLWADLKRGIAVLTVGAVLFLGWDLVAIDQGFYQRGGSNLMSGVEVAPELPLEEVFFVVFLCYVTLVLHRLVVRFLFTARSYQDVSS